MGTVNNSKPYSYPTKNESVGNKANTVTPSNTTKFTETKGLYVGVSGDVTVTIGGTDVLFKGLSAGMIHPLSVTAVKSTGTTATNIIAVY
jgi:hypothetical protein